MTKKLFSAIAAAYPVEEIPTGEFSRLKANGMTFRIRAWQAKGLGHISIMTAAGFFGLMKMDTLIINPTAVDMPLLSYDRVHAMGNDTLIFELYSTCLGSPALAHLSAAAKGGENLPNHDLGSHWYDGIKLPQSISKKGKKPHTEAFDALAQEYLAAYLKDCAAAAATPADAKREKASVYVEGLLSHGGPSTDVFKKALGFDTTARLFRGILFGTHL